MPVPRPRNRFLSLLSGDRGAVTILVVVFFGLNWQLLVGQASEQWDAELFFAPFYHYVSELARHGHLLYWNPFCSGGSPDFAEPQIGAFSPVTLLFGLLAGPGPFGFHLYWLAVWLLGGLGMYVLARSLSAPPWGALLTAVAFVFSGFYIGHAEHTSVVYTFSFVPWVLWRVRVALTEDRWWAACEAGALWGLSALAGNPAVHIPAAMFIAVVTLAWLPTVPPGGSRWLPWRKYAVTLTLLTVVGVLVLAPAYLSFRYEVAGYSHRTLPLPREAVLAEKFGWTWLTALATPAFTPFNGVPGWAEFDISMREIYFGSALPVLAVFALWRRRACWRTWVVFGAGLFCLGVSMGASLPLRAWLYDLLPFTRFLRHPPMFRGFFVLATAMLAAPATAFIEARRRGPVSERSLRPLAVAAGACALLGLGGCLVGGQFLPAGLWALVPLWAFGHLALAWTSPAILCTAAQRWQGVRRCLPGALTALTMLDLTAAHVATNRVAFRAQPSGMAANLVTPLTDLGADGFARIADGSDNTNLYAGRATFASYTAMRNESQIRWAGDDLLRPYVLGPQRVWFAADVPTVPVSGEVFQAFVQRAHALGALPVVRQERADLLRPGTGLPEAAISALLHAPVAQALDCQVLAYHDNDLTLRVSCPRAGFLLVTERWSRSWQARVDGLPVPIDGGDFLFRLVPVHPGPNLLTMHFDVAWVRALVALSWGSLAGVGSISLLSAWKRRAPGATAGVRLSEIHPVAAEAVAVEV